VVPKKFGKRCLKVKRGYWKFIHGSTKSHSVKYYSLNEINTNKGKAAGVINSAPNTKKA
jgi:hypothetical protein